jgi:chorismate mutase
MNPLDEWRTKIDEIDLQLVKLLNERAHCAEEIGKIKLELGLDAYSPQREEEVMRNITAGNPGPLTGFAIRRLFERIIDESRSVERILMIKRATSEKKK